MYPNERLERVIVTIAERPKGRANAFLKQAASVVAVWCGLVLVHLLFTPTTQAEDLFPNLNIVTEEWAPYQYTENGQLKGSTVDFLLAILKAAGSRQGREDVQVLPWARAYLRVQNEPNTVLFSTTRTPERENLFKWVGPILKNSTYFIGKKSRNYKIQTSKDLHKYQIGVIIDDASELFAKRHAVPQKHLTRNSRADINIKMLEAGRIDFVVTGWTAFELEARTIGADPSNYERVFLADSSHVSFAFNRNTPDWIIDRFFAAYRTVRKTGEFDYLTGPIDSGTN